MASVKLYLLGGFQLLIDGEPHEGFRSEKVRAMFAYLVQQGDLLVRRSHLGSLFWHGYQTTSALASVRVSLNNLREILAPSDFFYSTRLVIQFRSNHPDFWCDALELDKLAQAAQGATSPDIVQRVRELYRGPFLAGFEEIDSLLFQTWLLERRTHYRELVAKIEQQGQTERSDQTLAAPVRPAPVATPARQPVVRQMTGSGPVAPRDLLHLVPAVETFYGRQAELAQLTTWIVDQRCRLVSILGMGGQGKTMLAAKLVRTLAERPSRDSAVPDPAAQVRTPRPVGEEAGFVAVLWGSLVNAPPLSEILQTWIQLLSGYRVEELPASLDQQFDLLLTYLRQQRCLLVLDNLESVMTTGERAGQYRPGYEGYGQLLQRVGEFDHQSCLLLTSREEPYGLKRLEIGAATIRSLRLGGLAVDPSQAMLHHFGLTGDAEASAEVVRRYSGNPLALKLVAAVILELFAGDMRVFLNEETLVFDDIRDVLDQHFIRRSALEREVMNWLAIERESIELPTLLDNLVKSPSPRVVLETLRSLHRCSLLEQDGERLSLQNVVLEYTTDRLVENVCRELQDDKVIASSGEIATLSPPHPVTQAQPSLVETRLNRFALVKAQAKEYVRESQVRLLLQPVADFLTGRWSKEALALRLQQQLTSLRSEAPLAPGYAAANILHLLLHLKIDVRGYDFSRLTIWQADLGKAGLLGVNLAQADMAHSVFMEPFEIIRSLAFSPDGQRLIGGAYNGDIHIWQMVDHQLERLLQGHRGVVYSVAVSPTGRLLASASSDQTARLWDLTTGELYCTLRGHGSEVLLVAFDASGELLISMSQDGVIRTWAVPTLLNNSVWDQPLTKFGGTDTPMYHAAASGDGAWVAGGGDDTIVRCWDVESGQLRASLQGHTQAISNLVISRDGKTLASSGRDGTIRLWTLADQAEAAAPDHLRYSLREPASQLAFRPDGELLVSGFDPQLSLWEVETGNLRQRLVGHTGKIAALAISPDGKTLASASYDQSVLLWNVSSGQAEHKLYGQARSVELVSFSPDGATLLSSYYDHTVHLWTQDGRHLHTLPDHEYVVRHAACSPDGRLLATSGTHKTIHLWDLRSGEHRFTLRRHTSYDIPCLAFSPDGVTLASGGGDALVCLWDVQLGEPLGVLQGHTSQIRWLVFNPEGTLLASSSGDHTIGIWNIGAHGSLAAERGQLRHVLQGHTAMVRCVDFHPDGRTLASASDDNTVGIWDATTGQLYQILQGHTQAVTFVRFSRDGRTLVSVSDDQTMCVWTVDAATGKYQRSHVLPEQVYKFDCVALSPDNTTLVSGSVDTTVRVWDLQTGQLCRALKGHTNVVTSVDISPDGQRIVSGCSNGTVRLWDAQTGACLHTPRPEGPYTGMNITGVTGITEAQKAALKALGAVEEARDG